MLPHADAFRVEAVGAKRGRARSANPAVAAFVAFVLFFKALLQGLHQSLEAAHRLYLRTFLITEIELRLVPQPVIRNLLHQVGKRIFDTFEISAKDAVETIQVRFVFYEARSRKEIEVIHTLAGQASFHCFEQCEQLRDGRLQTAITEHVEERYQHDYCGLLRRSRNTSCSNRCTSCSFFNSAP